MAPKSHAGPLVVAIVKDGVEYPIKPEEQYLLNRQIKLDTEQEMKLQRELSGSAN